MNRYVEAIRSLASGEQSTVDISETLYKQGCYYLLSKMGSRNQYANKMKAENVLNKLCIIQRYRTCDELFREFEEHSIPYAVIKGAVLSSSAYNDPFCRRSGDIDVLISRKSIDVVKQFMLQAGFVQGRITENGIEPYSRKELLFQTSMSHQTAPFVKETNNQLCPYVNVDINLDILWGESGTTTDMEFVLENIQNTVVYDIPVKKLCPEMEFIALCLHHYKDMNSLYLLYERGLALNHFCDIYFFVSNCRMDPETLHIFCQRLDVGAFVYYCLYYANRIFKDNKLEEYMALLYSESAEALLDQFGLTDQERQVWDIDFYTRLFDLHMRDYLENKLSDECLNKIKINQMYM